MIPKTVTIMEARDSLMPIRILYSRDPFKPNPSHRLLIYMIYQSEGLLIEAKF
jgi:hypothetical protein